MNRLALCKGLHLRMGAGGNEVNGTLPSSTTGQTGRLLEIVTWIDEAWEDIQNSQKYWLWMYKVATYSATAGSSDFTITGSLTDFEHIWPFVGESCDPYILTRPSGGVDSPVYFLPHSEFMGYYTRVGVASSTGVPQIFTITPAKHMLVFPTLAADQTITIPYRKTNQALTADDTTPDMPSRFHSLIIYKALQYYGASDESTRQYQTALERYNLMYRDLCNSELANPKIFGR